MDAKSLMRCPHCPHCAVIYERKINIPKEFDAIKRFFKPGNIAKLDWAQVEELRQEMLRIALTLTEGNKTKAGKLLGMSKTTVASLIKPK